MYNTYILSSLHARLARTCRVHHPYLPTTYLRYRYRDSVHRLRFTRGAKVLAAWTMVGTYDTYMEYLDQMRVVKFFYL